MAFNHWDKLLWGIEQGECVLFLGPELPVVPAAGQRRLPADALAERLTEGLKRDGADPAELPSEDLARVAQRFLAREDEVGLEMEVTRWHRELGPERSALHDDLAALPFRSIITSAHDPLMETALRRAGKSPAVERYHYLGINRELLPVATAQAPVLFHLYGHVAEPRSVVLTETQLLDFLTALIAGTPPLPHDLNATLTNGRLFLFLGFGLDRWYLRILLRVLKVLRRGSRAFAVEVPREGVSRRRDDAILFYRENYKADIHYHDVVEFVRELRSRCVAAAPASGTAIAPAGGGADATIAAPPAEPAAAAAPGAPRIFLCHASEDHARAAELYAALERAGLAPWLDRQSLRGGDRWDPLIESTIQDMDFVVVLNSRALLAKSRGASYVNKEIKVALRAEDWRLGSFIIPVRIDDAPLLDPLAAFHAVDLTAPRGLRDLVRAIRRQVERR